MRSRERFRRLANGACGTGTLRCLVQRQRQAAQIQADDQTVLLAGERQHGAALVGEDHGLRLTGIGVLRPLWADANAG